MEVTKDKVLKAGISLNDIYTTVGAFLGGSYERGPHMGTRRYKKFQMMSLLSVDSEANREDGLGGTGPGQ